MERVSKNRSRFEQAAIAVTLIIFLSLGAYLWLVASPRPAAKLSNFTEGKLKGLLREKTGLNILFVKVNKHDGAVSVIYFDDSAFDEKAVVYIAARDSKAIMSLLFGFTGISKVRVTQSSTFLSDKGEKEIDPAVSITLTREKADNIDWNTVNTTNKAELIGLASEVYIAPAVKDQIDAQDILEALKKQSPSH